TKATLLPNLLCDLVILVWKKKFSALKQQLCASQRIMNQEILVHNKELVRVNDEQSDPFLPIISPIPDGVHVAKRKRQSFSNWFLLVNNYQINLVQLGEQRNDHAFHSKLAPLVPISAVRNRDRQDVESIMENSSPLVRKILTYNAKTLTHTVVLE
ncbi:Hypothetical predicted protein, partial [Paramuricea clavata]